MNFQIVSSIISSGLIVTAFTTFYSDFINKPNIQVNQLPNANGTLIELKNEGMAPAKNVILTLESFARMSTDDVFTTENWTIFRNNSQQLVMHTPRLANGEGSIIRINAAINNASNSANPSYEIYLTHDQGSLKIPTEPDALGYLSNLPLMLFVAAILIFVFSFVYTSEKRSMQNKLVSSILKDMLYFKDRFDATPSDSLEVKDIGWARNSGYIKWAFSKDAAVYHLVCDFYKKLVDRNLQLKRRSYENGYGTIIGINQDIVNHIEKIQDTIHWEEYGKEPRDIYENYVKNPKPPDTVDKSNSKTNLYHIKGHPRLIIIFALMFPVMFLAFLGIGIFLESHPNLERWVEITILMIIPITLLVLTLWIYKKIAGLRLREDIRQEWQRITHKTAIN